jgi:hypothetical protein
VSSLYLCLAVCLAGTSHRWAQDAEDWGFTQFLSLEDALDPDRGFTLDDTLKIKVEVQVQVTRGYESYDGAFVCQVCCKKHSVGDCMHMFKGLMYARVQERRLQQVWGETMHAMLVVSCSALQCVM